MTRFQLLATACLAMSCSATPPPGSAAPTPSLASTAPLPAGSATGGVVEPGPDHPWQHRFVDDSEAERRVVEAVALAPSGHLAVVVSRRLQVYGPGGKPGVSVGVARPLALGFVRDDQLALVHRDGLTLFSWPDLVPEVVELKNVRAGSVGPGRVAVVQNEHYTFKDRVRVLAPLRGAAGPPTEVVDWFEIDEGLEDIRLSTDGRQLVVARREGVMVRDLIARRSLLRYPTDSRPKSASLSLEGDRLLIAANPPTEIRAKDGGAHMAYDYSGVVRDAAYVAGVPVVVYRDGVAVMPSTTRRWPLRGAKLSARGDALCGVAEGGALTCLHLDGQPSSSAPPRPTSPPPPEPTLLSRGQPRGYTTRWRREFEKADDLFFSPDGKDLVAIHRYHRLEVLSAETGETQRTASLCHNHGTVFGFTGPHDFVALCGGRAIRYAWPSLAEEQAIPLKRDPNHGAIATGVIAFSAHDKPVVSVFEAPAMKLRHTFPTSGVVKHGSLVLSEDGRKLAFGTDRGVFVHDVSTRRTRKLMASPRRELVLSPKGERLLVLDDGVLEISTRDGTQLRAWGDRSSYDGRYLDGSVAILGQGLGIINWSNPSEPNWAYDLDRALAVRRPGKVCAAGAKTIACFVRDEP